MNTIDYMTALKSALGITSDYALAQRLGVTQPAVSKWRVGKATIGDDQAPLIAQLLNIPVEKVVADLHIERERNPALRVVWQSISQQFARAAVLLLAFAVFNITLAPRTSEAATPAPATFFVNNAAEYKFPNFGLFLFFFRRWLCRLLAPGALAY